MIKNLLIDMYSLDVTWNKLYCVILVKKKNGRPWFKKMLMLRQPTVISLSFQC